MTEQEQDFSFRSLFVPLTTLKALHFIIIIGFIVYFNCLFNGFVWDDLSNIIYNPQVHVLSFGNISGNKIINTGLQFRPVVTFYFSFMYSLFEDTAFIYHLFNIVFHIINATLVFLLFKRLFSLRLSLFLSLIFLVHPMQVESAVWISTAGNFYFLFGMWALLLSLKDHISLKRAILISILLLLSLLSKETGIVFIAMILLYKVLSKSKNFICSLLISIPVLLLYVILRFLSNVSFTPPSMIVPIAKLTLYPRLLNIPEIIVYYFKTFFFPLKLVIMQYWVITNIDFKNFYLPLTIILFFLFVSGLTGVYLFKKNRKNLIVFVFFFCWLIAGLLLNVQIISLDMTVADRWFYFPMVGLLGIIGLVIQLFGIKFRQKYIRIVILTCGVVLLLLLSLRTVVRNQDWHDDLTLYLHDRQILTNFSIENNIGWNYQHVNDFKDAYIFYKNSYELFPYYAISINNLGYACEMLGKKEEARTYFYKVLQAGDYYPELYNRDLSNTASFLNQKDSPEVARDFTIKALKKDPQNGELWKNLALAEYKMDNRTEALKSMEKAMNLSSTPEIENLYQQILTNIK